MISIVKFIKRCALACILSYAFAATPSWADICFLPTGACEKGAVLKTAIQKTCDDYAQEDGYFMEEKEDMNCSLANIPGCTLYECTAKSCEDRGFKIPGTSSEDDYPGAPIRKHLLNRKRINQVMRCAASVFLMRK